MAAAWQNRQSKRGRDDYCGGLALPDTKRINSELTVAQGSDLMASLDEINDLDAIDCNPEEAVAGNELEIISDIRITGVIESLEDEIGLKVQTTNKIESSEEKGSANQMGPLWQGELTEDGSNSGATSACDIEEWPYYDDVRGQLGCFVEDISPNDLGIINDNYMDGVSMANIIYSNHSYAENMEDFYGFLWEDDIWQLNEHPVIQNDFESSQQEEVGLVVSEADFPALWNDIRRVQRLSDEEKGP